MLTVTARGRAHAVVDAESKKESIPAEPALGGGREKLQQQAVAYGREPGKEPEFLDFLIEVMKAEEPSHDATCGRILEKGGTMPTGKLTDAVASTPVQGAPIYVKNLSMGHKAKGQTRIACRRRGKTNFGRFSITGTQEGPREECTSQVMAGWPMVR